MDSGNLVRTPSIHPIIKAMHTSERPVKYLAIYEEIAGLIKKGALEPGSRIPSENEIINRHKVSNTTARKALQRLEHEGYALRIKGRGTFVREKPVFRPATEILSFSENMRRSGLEPSTRVLSAGKNDGGATLCIGNQNHQLAGPYYEISRLRFGDNLPIMREIRFIDAGLCPSLTDQNLLGSLYKLYEGFGLELSEIYQSLTPVILEGEELEFFNLEKPTPGMLLEGASYNNAGRLVELERSFYRGDSYSFIVSARKT